MGEPSDGDVRPEAVLAVLLMVSILLMIFSGTFKNESGREFGSQVVLSIQRVIGGTTYRIRDGIESFRRLQTRKDQYESVLAEFRNYQGLERSVIELKRENAALKKQLGFSRTLEFENIPVRVIAGDPSNLFSSLTIDKGTHDGIRMGMVVTSFQDGFFGLLGKVEVVGVRSSQVRPIIDPDHYVAARLEKSRFEGLIEGHEDGNGELLMRYVRKSAGAQVKINDLVVTSGMNSLYPPGIYVGRVKELRSRDYSTSLELILTPIIDVTRVEYAFVLGDS